MKRIYKLLAVAMAAMAFLVYFFASGQSASAQGLGIIPDVHCFLTEDGWCVERFILSWPLPDQNDPEFDPSSVGGCETKIIDYYTEGEEVTSSCTYVYASALHTGAVSGVVKVVTVDYLREEFYKVRKEFDPLEFQLNLQILRRAERYLDPDSPFYDPPASTCLAAVALYNFGAGGKLFHEDPDPPFFDMAIRMSSALYDSVRDEDGLIRCWVT